MKEFRISVSNIFAKTLSPSIKIRIKKSIKLAFLLIFFCHFKKKKIKIQNNKAKAIKPKEEMASLSIKTPLNIGKS